MPILEARPPGRAPHKHCELGEAIPEALYIAVAVVPAYVYQLRRFRREGGIFPEMSHSLPVLRFAGLEHGVGQLCGLV